METVKLRDASAHVGELVRFTAAVQQVTTGRRAVIARQQVRPYHVVHVGDATRQFFKVTCWGEVPPALVHSNGLASESGGDSESVQLPSSDAALRVGDIVLFSGCRVKANRGNVEAQFVVRHDETATSSTVQLLYRKDRYFSTQDVRLVNLYPMIEWYKQHSREFLASEEGVKAKDGTVKRRNRSKIRELRENMVASVVCKLRRQQDSAVGGGIGSELDGVLLCELQMFDTKRDAMTINLWDQHADKQFIARLLEHRGGVEIVDIVISIQALSNQLVANTTPHTAFRLLDADNPESIQLDKNLASVTNAQRLRISAEPYRSVTLEELESSVAGGLVTIENIRVEQMCLSRHFGSDSRVLPKFAPLLAESYCTGCNHALPELPHEDNNIQLSYGTCENRCKTRQGSTTDAPCSWRYRNFQMNLRGARNRRLQVEVSNEAIVDIVGNIEAQHLVETSENVAFNAAAAVSSLLNALVEDAAQSFDAQLISTPVNTLSLSSSQNSDTLSGASEGDKRVIQRTYTLVSLSPTSNDPLPI